ncbi:MAG: hypothetical protein FK731_04450 [Asgard group archaeon]|nr:hypothetical protein [Asgard group archaeon]
MKRICSNCQKKFSNKKPICPYCFVVDREHYSREELFEFLEIYLPTKSITKKQSIVSTKKKIEEIKYFRWLIVGIITLGFGYQFYLLMTLKALNDHWYFSHRSDENTTQVDMFTTTLLIFFSNFIGMPILQYIRYEKLCKHIKKAPKTSIKEEFNVQASLILWLTVVFYILFSGTIAMLVLGIGSIMSGLYFNFNSTFLVIIFFSGSGLVFISSIIVAQRLVKYDKLWQEIFNYHIDWHKN